MRFCLYCYRHSYEISYFFTVCGVCSTGISGYNTISQTFMANGCCYCYFVLARTNYAHRRRIQKSNVLLQNFYYSLNLLQAKEKKRTTERQKATYDELSFVDLCLNACVFCV